MSYQLCCVLTCGKLAVDDNTAVKMCVECAKLVYETEKAKLIAEYTQTQVVTEAIQWVKDCRAHNVSRVYEDTPSACLGRVTVMLGLYGSKPESILHVIHSHGHESVTLADVVAVREFVLKGA